MGHILQGKVRYAAQRALRILFANPACCLLVMMSLLMGSGETVAKPAPSDILGTYRSGVLSNGAKATLKLERVDKWIVGQLTDESGRVFALRGRGNEKLVEGKIFLENRSVSFVVERVGASVFLSYASFDSRGRSAAHRSLLLQKVHAAETSSDSVHRQALAFSSFLKTYQRLSDKDIAAQLVSFDPGLRTLVQIFGYLHADIYARVCRRDKKSDVVKELGWSQSLSCNQVVARLTARKNADQRKELVSRARKQAFALADVVGCIGRSSAPQPHSACDRLGVTLSPIASAWQDVAVILPHDASGTPQTLVAQALIPRLKPEQIMDAAPVIPVLNPLRMAVAEHPTRQPPASLDFHKLPVTYRSVEIATLHEWSLAHGDGPHATAEEEAVGAVDTAP